MSSRMPKYPRSRRVYIDCMEFCLACLSVLLKDPRLTFAFVGLNWAFSSYVRRLEVRFSANASIKSVSSCVLVKLLFSTNVLAIGSSNERFSHFWTVFFRDKVQASTSGEMDTILYTDGYRLCGRW